MRSQDVFCGWICWIAHCWPSRVGDNRAEARAAAAPGVNAGKKSGTRLALDASLNAFSATCESDAGSFLSIERTLRLTAGVYLPWTSTPAHIGRLNQMAVKASNKRKAQPAQVKTITHMHRGGD